MANDVLKAPDTDISSLIGGIINDGQELLKQQFALLKTEVQDDVRGAAEVTASLAIGAVTIFLGLGLFCFMLVHLLFTLTGWPLWVCFGVVGALVTVIGGVLVGRVWPRVREFRPLPQTEKALEENLQWKTQPQK